LGTRNVSDLSISIPGKGLKSRFLEGLAGPDLMSILGVATSRRLLANSIVINQEAPAEYLFLLTEGRARHFFVTQEGQRTLLYWITPGEVFGIAALLPDPSSYLVSTEMIRDSRLLVWDRATIRDLAARYPRLLDNAHLIASDYFAWYIATHVALTSHSAQQRLAQILVTLAGTIGHKVQGGVELDVTNEELANAANITLFTSSRFLSRWQRNGAVVKSRGKVLLRSPEQLFHSV
jgi:CRP-like cAMP-binding protein